MPPDALAPSEAAPVKRKPLTDDERSFIKLILRSPDEGDGWRHVSPLVWRGVVVRFDRPELIEAERHEDEGGRIRLTERGVIVSEYLV